MPRSTSGSPTAQRSPGYGSSTRRRAPSSRRPFSPRGSWSQVEPRATQEVLRGLFARWGLPERLRVDNGPPWGSQGDLPTDLACWLAGLGVGVLLNPPRRPEDNGVVERSQGVGKAWGEPDRCASAAELQGRLDELDRWQRELYPIAGDRTRSQTYPGLKHSGRRYRRAREAATWDIHKAWALVGAHVVPRRVSSAGKVSLYNRPYTVGLMWAGRTIWVGFDSEQGAWTFHDERGQEIRRQEADELRGDRVLGLDVTNRRRGIHAAKPGGRSKAARQTGHSKAARPTGQ
jgi:hypothetical protein